MTLCAKTCRILVATPMWQRTYRSRGQSDSERRQPMRCCGYLCVLLLALLCASPVRATELQLAYTLSGSEFQYVVQNGDSLASIGSRLGVESLMLTEVNRLDTRARLQPGSTIW